MLEATRANNTARRRIESTSDWREADDDDDMIAVGLPTACRLLTAEWQQQKTRSLVRMLARSLEYDSLYRAVFFV